MASNNFPTSQRGRRILQDGPRGGRGPRHVVSDYHPSFQGEAIINRPAGRSEGSVPSRGRFGARGGGGRENIGIAGERGTASYHGAHPHGGRLTNSSTRKTNPMGINLLTRLITTEPNDFTRLLYENRKPLELLLKQQNMDDETMQLLINVLSKACRVSDQQSERMIEVFNIVNVSNFLDINLVQWIPKWNQLCFTQDVLEKNLLSTIDICTNMLEKFLGNVSAVGVTLLVLNSVVEGFEKNDIFVTSEVKEKLTSLRETHETFLIDSKELSVRRAGMSDNSREPPDNFREVPVLPCPDELRRDYKPFLRKNIVDGKYDNINHYLDVHYRLLREDFIAPIREGIAEYTDELARQGAKSKKRLNNFRLYNNVHAVGIERSKGVESYKLKFDIDDHLKAVKWELSQRLIFGSLICLSRDDFKTLIFGVVENSDRNKLAVGSVEVTFDLEPHLVQEIFTHSFKMAESPSYFEAYRHVLACLQELNADDFPFARYIINTKRIPDLPLYIIENPECKFDLSDLNKTALEDAEQMSCQVDVQKLKAVCVRDDENWPSHETLGFDVSQMRAYQAALREEVCLIQGPPGTGKTYVGLRIVKTLLRNRKCWGNNRPLMVVCYTNHALDQFLEGIIEFESNGIVRIGGRSSSEKLSQFNLNTLRSTCSSTWEYRRAREEMDNIVKMIKNYESLNGVAKRKLLKFKVLQQFMKCEHREWLSGPSMPPSTDPIALWLGILDEAGKYCFDPRQAYYNYEQYRGEADKVKKFKGDQYDISKEAKKDAGTENSTVLENEEFERRYITDEGDTFAYRGNTVLSLRRPEDITISLPYEHQHQPPQQNERASTAKLADIFIGNRLVEDSVMADEEVKGIWDIWHLDCNQRWRLYCHWVQLYIDYNDRKVRELCDEYSRKTAILKELQMDGDLKLLRGKSVIGLTTTGAAKNNKLLRSVGPRIIVVEEAAEIMESHVITSLSSYTEHLILIGDHQQLRPSPTVYKLCKNYNLDVSLFERLIKNGMPHYRLSLQHRMRPEISQILKLHKDFYPALRDHESVMRYEDVHGITKNMYFVEHDVPERHADDSNSRSNIHEAQFLLYLCKYLLKQGYTPDQITILTAYKGQVYAFRQIMESSFKGVRVCPVDNYQGEENDIILFSFVRSNLEGSIGFLKVSNRVCVALSRARKGLYCIGNFSLMSQQSELWATIVSYLRSEGFIGPSLKLVCRNHPERCIEAKTFADFKEAPDGGCKEPCSARLDCGHTCQLKCHPVDREHRKILCQRPCEEIVCRRKHVCPERCWEDCPELCPKLMLKTLPCSHKQQVQCHEKPHDVSCGSPCERELPCGHGCRELCGSECTVSCQEVVDKVFTPCGHKAKVPCCEYLCPKKCRDMLKCEHICRGTCGKCSNGRYHVRCKEVCKRALICGHICQQTCSRSCPPCTRPCENRCQHNKCHKTCGETCVPCKERCTWRCKHIICRRPCGSDCGRKTCDLPCPQQLECKHNCIGLCGESCPKLCRKCNRDDVTTILFGDEDDPEARFIHLDDCNHIVEVHAMDHLMKQNEESGENEIKIPVCPWCRTPIRYNKRYNNRIKAIRRDFEEVKTKIKGDKHKIETERSGLFARIAKVQEKTKINSRVPYRYLKLRVSATPELGQDNQWRAFFQKLKEKLDKNPYTISLEDLFGVSIILDMYDKLMQINNVKAKTLKVIKPNLIVDMKELKQFQEYFGFLEEKTKCSLDTPSDQEIEDWQNEYQRCRHSLSLVVVLCAFKDSDITRGKYEKVDKMVDEVDGLLSDRFPFSKEKDDRVRTLLKDMKDFNPLLLEIGISEDERQMVVKAMEFRKGHWFKCPNGHIYAIGECGGASQISQCPECKATIGGMSHRLDEGNSLASEMDGASFAAYSQEANNMFNFELNDVI